MSWIERVLYRLGRWGQPFPADVPRIPKTVRAYELGQKARPQ